MSGDHESPLERWIKELPSRMGAHRADPSSGISAEEVHSHITKRLKQAERADIAKAREILSRAGRGNPPVNGDEVDG